MNAWITKEKSFEVDGLRGELNNFVGMEQWTATAADCLYIRGMENIDIIEADDLEFGDAGLDYDSDSGSADGAE
jgi:hypothetical protein